MRPSRSRNLMDHALLASQRATCERLQVGALVHREGRILATGYNGAPAGVPHCDHSCDCGYLDRLQDIGHAESCRHLQPCTVAQHAERNLIDFCARHGIKLLGAEMYTTDTPCLTCAGSIVNAGILSVVAFQPYRVMDGWKLLEGAGVHCSLFEDPI